MTRYVKIYCLTCGEASWGDITEDDAFDWHREHVRDSGHPMPVRSIRVEDGEEYRIPHPEVAGFKVGEHVEVTDGYARSLMDEPYDFTIERFDIYGYQGIVAIAKGGQAGGAAYLDHISKIGA